MLNPRFNSLQFLSLGVHMHVQRLPDYTKLMNELEEAGWIRICNSLKGSYVSGHNCQILSPWGGILDIVNFENCVLGVEELEALIDMFDLGN
jgi:hypothetical protein